MMPSIRFPRLRSFAVLSILGLSFLSTVAGSDIPLTQVGIWNDIDACAQSCAISASSAFSSLAACPTSDPASCICNVAPAVSAVAGAAHQCASASCGSFPSSSADPERARAALTSYCFSNGIVSTGTTLRAKITTSSSPSTSSSTSLAPPSSQFSSTAPQSSSSPSMVISTSSTNLLANPSTFQTTSSVQATTSSSTPPWISTKAGEAEVGAAVSFGVISILGFVIFLWKIRKPLHKWIKRSEGDQRDNSEGKDRGSEERGATEMGDLALSGRGKKGEQGGESATSTNDEREPVVTRDGSQGPSTLNPVHGDGRSSLHPHLLHVTTKNGHPCDCYAKPDTGLEGGNFISIAQLRNLGFDEEDLKPSTHTWNALGDPELPTFGSIKLTWTTNDRTEPERPVKFYVVNGEFTELILGKDFLFDKGLITYNPKAWLGVQNRTMTEQERQALRQSNAGQAQQNIAERRLSWQQEPSGRWFYFNSAGVKVYRDQGESSSGSGGPGGQGQNQGGGPSGGSAGPG